MANDDKTESAETTDSNKPLPKKNIEGIVTDLITEKVLKMSSVPKEERLAKLTNKQKQQLNEVIDRAIRDGSGQLDELESALGMLLLGHHYGWKVLYLIHSKKTIRKYEEILGIKVREFFDPTGPSSPRSIGLAFAEKYPNFWKVVSGDVKIPDRRKVE